ncbi:MAG: lipoyl synthase [Verrucomicrobiae bacterium]|nr:lipoyl synthase [Verrucomicrobiae bacterium]
MVSISSCDSPATFSPNGPAPVVEQDPRRVARSLVPRPRFPSWLRRPIPPAGAAPQVRRALEDLKLPTVCIEARCPNLHDCFARRTATFMILGDLCTRACRFCSVTRGRPAPPREEEPQAVAEACARLKMRHVVLTSVTRDDLSDGGAGHFAKTIRAIKARLPAARVEVLTPDFRGDTAAVDTILEARPEVFSHNLETVERLQRSVRGQANYAHSLAVLAHAARRAVERNGGSSSPPEAPFSGGNPAAAVKSGLMLGLGETFEETRAALRDLRAVGCVMLTIGQYLPPSPKHAPVARFVAPEEFDLLAREARAMGFAAVAAGPFVRSSYMAEEAYAERRSDRAPDT